MHMVYRLLFAAFALAVSAWACAETTAFEREVAADPRGIVEVSSTTGVIEVSAWDKPAVAVKAELGSDVEHVDVTTSGNHTVVRVVLKPHMGFNWSHDETRLRVQVPKDSEVDASTVSGSVTSAGVSGT